MYHIMHITPTLHIVIYKTKCDIYMYIYILYLKRPIEDLILIGRPRMMAFESVSSNLTVC